MSTKVELPQCLPSSPLSSTFSLPPLSQPRRNIGLPPLNVNDDANNSEKLLAYFPQLNATTPRSGSSSFSGTPTAFSSSPRHLLPRIRSSSPTDVREDQSLDPRALLRRKLKLPMTNQQPRAIKEQFLTFDSLDTLDNQKSMDVPIRLADCGRDDSLASIGTSLPDEKSCHNSPHTSFARHYFTKQTDDSPRDGFTGLDRDGGNATMWQKLRGFYEPNAEEDLTGSCDSFDSEGR